MRMKQYVLGGVRVWLWALLTVPLAFASPSTEKSSENILANLHLPDGSIVQFHEPLPGEVVILAQTPISRSAGRSVMINGVDLKDLNDLDPVEIYSILSGGLQAPTGLIEARQRVKEGQRERVAALPEMPPGEEQPEAGPASDRSSTKTSSSGGDLPATRTLNQPPYPYGSNDWFRAYHCAWSENFCSCYLNRTGDNSQQRYGSNMYSTAYPYRGNVTQQLEYWDCPWWGCSWQYNIAQTVYQGYVGHIWAQGSDRYRRASMSNAVFDGWDWAIYGGNLRKQCSGSTACACWNS